MLAACSHASCAPALLCRAGQLLSFWLFRCYSLVRPLSAFTCIPLRSMLTWVLVSALLASTARPSTKPRPARTTGRVCFCRAVLSAPHPASLPVRPRNGGLCLMSSFSVFCTVTQHCWIFLCGRLHFSVGRSVSFVLSWACGSLISIAVCFDFWNVQMWGWQLLPCRHSHQTAMVLCDLCRRLCETRCMALLLALDPECVGLPHSAHWADSHRIRVCDMRCDCSPPGRFGSTGNLATATCTGQCSAGERIHADHTRCAAPLCSLRPSAAWHQLSASSHHHA